MWLIQLYTKYQIVIKKEKIKLTLLDMMPMSASSTALSISASSKIMRGDLPPNSSETVFKLLLAADCITSRPTSTEPVKLT